MSEFDTLRSRRFACPACGGRMTFDPAAQQLRCPYCGTHKPFEMVRVTPNAYDIRFGPLEEDRAWEDRTRVVRCADCGAELILTGETAVERCPFCTGSCTAEETGKPGVAPESLIPFRIPREEAERRFRRWMRWKLFAPRAARRRAARGDIDGVYLAQWGYTDAATSVYQGRAGKAKKAGKDETGEQADIAWEPASGVVEGTFDDLTAPGGERVPGELLEAAGPFQAARAVRYVPEYLAGFAAEKPSSDVREGWISAQRAVDERMAEIAREDILSHADRAEVSGLTTTHGGVRYRLTLLPVYLCAFRYRKKTFHLLMNGFTGRVSGNVPLSRLRVLIAVLLVLALLAGGYILFMSTGGSEYMFYDFGRRIMETLSA